MPLQLPENLPSVEALRNDRIPVTASDLGKSEQAPQLRIVILNLMPIKETTEYDLLRLLSTTPLEVEVELMRIGSHVSKNTSEEHLNRFYKTFEALKEEHFDGMIITGAPLEQMGYEDVRYWEELQQIFEWARATMASTLFICWAAQAGLYHFYGIPKYALDRKMFGIFRHEPADASEPIFRGFDDEFFVPHSRHSEIRATDLLKRPELSILSESPESGVYLVKAREGREIYVTGHSEYAPYTLDGEYKRDIAKGLEIEKPRNYYRNDDPDQEPLVRWRAHANLLFSNWLTYYVNRTI